MSRRELFPSLRGQGMIAVDCETYDPELTTRGPGAHRNGFIAGVAIATEKGFRGYYPVAHENDPANLPKQKVFAWLKQELATDVPKVGANLLYDLAFLSAAGIEAKGLMYDIQIAEPLLDETLRSYSLETLSQKYLGKGKYVADMAAWIKEHFHVRKPGGYIWRAPSSVVRPYAIGDVENPLQIFKKQKALLEKQGLWELFLLETRLIPMLLAMRQRGVRVDVARAEELYAAMSKRQRALMKKVGGEFAPWNARDIAKICDKLGIEYLRTAKTDAPSFTKEWLSHHKHPVPRLIQEIRHLDKLRETFVKGAIIEGHHKGRLHCSFNQLRSDDFGTVSGRFSCVAGWTPIETSNGLKPINRLQAGDLVWTHKNRLRPVLATWVKGREQMFDVYFSNGNVLTCTKKHRVLLQSGQWTTIGEIRERFKNMDTRPTEYQNSPSLVSNQGAKELQANRDGNEIHGTECAGYSQPELIEAGAPCAVDFTLFGRENRSQKSNVGKISRTTSRLARREQSQSGSHDYAFPRQTGTDWARDDNEKTKLETSAFLLRGTPHRWQFTRQQFGQSSIGYSQGAQSHSCLAATGWQTVAITAIEVSGSFEVFDVTVAEDESYAACGVFSHNSSNFNLQQIPIRTDDGKAIRTAFLPDAGNDWGKADFSQIEYRLIAHTAAELELRGAQNVVDQYNKDPKTDFHQAIADMTGLSRYQAKTINFAMAYGAGVGKISDQLGLSTVEGTKVLNEYHRRAPFIKPLTNFFTEEADRNGQIETILGRVRHFNRWEGKGPEGPIYSTTRSGFFRKRAFTYRALNAYIQGSAADVLKQAMVDIWRSGVCDVLGAPHLTVHDELDWSVPKNKKGREAFLEAKHIMETAVQVSVPLLVDTGLGPNWGDVK